MIQIGLALLLLASFVACFFCSKYWHWAHVLLVEVLFLAGLGYFILAAEVLRIQSIYGKAYAANQQIIDRKEPLVEALAVGTRDASLADDLKSDDVRVALASPEEEGEEPRMRGVGEVDHELGLVTRTRGRVWRDANFVGGDIASLSVNLQIESPDPHGIEANTILYAFEQGPAAPYGKAGPRYLGEFRVTNAGPQQITLQPAGQFDERSIERLKSANQFPWILYENMPVDQYPEGRLGIFAGAAPEELKNKLPPESVEEYIRHGGEIRPDDDDWHKSGYDADGNLVGPDDWDNTTQFKYRRTLRDYNLIFQELSQVFVEMQADRNSLKEDIQSLNEALASAKKLQADRKETQRKLKHDLAGVQRDRKAIESHLAQLETQLANARTLLATSRQENARLEEQLEASFR